jgi:hypothetical protein
MNYRVFQFAIPCDEEIEQLNSFLSTHRVTSVCHYLVRSNESPMLGTRHLADALPIF